MGTILCKRCFNQSTIMAMEDLKLLGAKLSAFSCRVEWGLKMKGLQYEFIEEDICNKSLLLLNSNPVHKKIPVLIHAEKPVAESIIILEYIDEMWKENPILPEDPYERAQARFGAKLAVEFEDQISMAFRTQGEEQRKAVEVAKEALKSLEEEIEGKKFFGGEKIGLVDVVLGWVPLWLGVAEELSSFKLLDSNIFPRIHSWMKSFTEVPVIKENLPPRNDVLMAFRKLRHLHVSSV